MFNQFREVLITNLRTFTTHRGKSPYIQGLYTGHKTSLKKERTFL